MTTTQKVNKEAVRLLVIREGVREAARIAGLNENTVLSWAHRYKWKVAINSQSNGHSALVDNVASQLQDHERKTKLGLATYASTQAQHLAKNGKLKDSGHFKNVAGGASIVHRWDAKTENTNNVVVNVALLGVQPHEISVEARNVESECQDSGE